MDASLCQSTTAPLVSASGDVIARPVFRVRSTGPSHRYVDVATHDDAPQYRLELPDGEATELERLHAAWERRSSRSLLALFLVPTTMMAVGLLAFLLHERFGGTNTTPLEIAGTVLVTLAGGIAAMRAADRSEATGTRYRAELDRIVQSRLTF